MADESIKVDFCSYCHSSSLHFARNKSIKELQLVRATQTNFFYVKDKSLTPDED